MSGDQSTQVSLQEDGLIDSLFRSLTERATEEPAPLEHMTSRLQQYYDSLLNNADWNVENLEVRPGHPTFVVCRDLQLETGQGHRQTRGRRRELVLRGEHDLHGVRSGGEYLSAAELPQKNEVPLRAGGFHHGLVCRQHNADAAGGHLPCGISSPRALS
ncbi:hypothetical protein KL920_003486 [Ogataea angusta]|nr:hypothetical protein KL920_003486 [Ogataea angusta]